VLEPSLRFRTGLRGDSYSVGSDLESEARDNENQALLLDQRWESGCRGVGEITSPNEVYAPLLTRRRDF
jgi:hypothetical protein